MDTDAVLALLQEVAEEVINPRFRSLATDEIGLNEGVARTRRADVTLVPVDDAAAFETPITSAPIADTDMRKFMSSAP